MICCVKKGREKNDTIRHIQVFIIVSLNGVFIFIFCYLLQREWETFWGLTQIATENSFGI